MLITIERRFMTLIDDGNKALFRMKWTHRKGLCGNITFNTRTRNTILKGTCFSHQPLGPYWMKDFFPVKCFYAFYISHILFNCSFQSQVFSFFSLYFSLILEWILKIIWGDCFCEISHLAPIAFIHLLSNWVKQSFVKSYSWAFTKEEAFCIAF